MKHFFLCSIAPLYFIVFSLQCKKEVGTLVNSIASFHAEKQGLTIKKSRGVLPPTISIGICEVKNMGASLSIPIRVSVASVHAPETELYSYHFETAEQSTIYSEYLKSKAALYGAKKSYTRLKYLVENQAAAGKELNDVQVQVQQMAASLEENKNRLKLQGIQVEKLEELKLGWIFVIGDIPETKLNRVRENAKIKLKFNSFPSEIMETTIDTISDVIDPVSRTAKILLKLKNPSNKLKPGMYGNGMVELDNIETLAIPNTAIVTIGEANYVFKQVQEDTFERTKVITGIETDVYTQVIAGLTTGDKIIIQGAHLFKGLSFGY